MKERASKISIGGSKYKGVANSNIDTSFKKKRIRSSRNKSSLSTKYSDFKLDIKSNEFKKQISSLSKQGGVFNYEKTRKNIYETGSFLGSNKENVKYANMSNMKGGKFSKYSSSNSKIKTAIKPKPKKNRSISKTKSKLRTKTSAYSKKNKRNKSKHYKSPQGLRKLKERIREVYDQKKMNEVKTVKTKSFYAYKSQKDLNL